MSFYRNKKCSFRNVISFPVPLLTASLLQCGKCKHGACSLSFGTTLHNFLKLLIRSTSKYLYLQPVQLTGGVRRHCRDEGVPWPAPHPLHAPRGRCRGWRGLASLPAAALLEDRGPGAHEGGDGPRDRSGPFRCQLIVVPGAGIQVDGLQAHFYHIQSEKSMKNKNHFSSLVLSVSLTLGRMDSLRQTLENQGLRDVVYVVVNHQGAQAQRMHDMLTQRLSEHISLHKQDEAQADVWHTLGGSKDDFFIYDRLDTRAGTRPFRFLQDVAFLSIFNAFPSIYNQVWPSRSSNFPPLVHYWTRQRGESDQRHLLQRSLWRVCAWGMRSHSLKQTGLG